MGHRLTWVSQRGRKKVALAPRPSGSREPSKDSRPSPLPILRGWRSHLHLEESPQILSFLLEGEPSPAHPLLASSPSRLLESPTMGLAALTAVRREGGQTTGGTSAQGNDGGRSCLLPGCLPGWRSSVFLNPHLFLPLLTPPPPRMGREGGGGQCQVGPPPSEPGLLPCSPARPLPGASVWRSHSALTRLAGSGSRKIGRVLARRGEAAGQAVGVGSLISARWARQGSGD